MLLTISIQLFARYLRERASREKRTGKSCIKTFEPIYVDPEISARARQLQYDLAESEYKETITAMEKIQSRIIKTSFTNKDLQLPDSHTLT